ncbi:site-specific integrase [Frankia sp. R82]|uniref:tyrosine-type recombinase/integrase n=1 Tax=Frankia sp. R82 TaxID=2950553 RepID=UPI002044A0CD|nr:site-specific integrase [Frankia sp. R82]MCM3883105.1 site-specific integrase [Frankia sp. R82]
MSPPAAVLALREPADPRVAAILAVLRPEFQVHRFMPPAGHFLTPKVCVIEGCPGGTHAHGLCPLHCHAWETAGRPDLTVWVADPANVDVGWAGPVRPCPVAGCPHSQGGWGLCDEHRRHSTPTITAGVTTVDYVAGNPPVIPRPTAEPCGYPGCGFPTSQDGLCDGHRYRWTRLGRPPLAELPAAVEALRYPGYTLRGLPPLARLEFQYLLQVRTDTRRSHIPLGDWNQAVRLVTAAGVISVRDRDLAYWQGQIRRGCVARGLFRMLLDALDDLHNPGREWDRDVWRPDRLGFDLEARRGVPPLHFDRISQPWLRELVKRYFRLRLATVELRSVAGQLSSFHWLSRFLADCRADRQHDPAVLDRPTLEQYVGWLVDARDQRPGKFHGRTLAARTRKLHLSKLKGFLEAWRRYGWTPRLPDDAHIYVDDLPRVAGLNANFIDEYLMAQIEAEENLALLDPETRTMVLICRDEGLRIGEALTLKTDCLRKLPSGRWALVHYKSKDKSYRAIPASATVVDAVHGQVQRVHARFGDRCGWLFPGINQNPDGFYFVSYTTLTKRFDAWLDCIQLADAHGRRATVNWHQFRHTLGTRMANAGVSGRTIREVLGHTSWSMQEHYSRIADDTLRREYEEKYEVRFNRKGEAVRIRPDADLGGVEWLAEQIGRRLHAVAGGWCGRHLARACPKNAADGCYTCPDFQATPDLLPIHEDTLARTRQLQADAERTGRTRVAEKNARLADAVSHLITRIRTEENHHADRRTGPALVLDTAADAC